MLIVITYIGPWLAVQAALFMLGHTAHRDIWITECQRDPISGPPCTDRLLYTYKHKPPIPAEVIPRVMGRMQYCHSTHPHFLVLQREQLALM